MIPTERAFLRQRLALVEHWLEKPGRESFSYAKGRIQQQNVPEPPRPPSARYVDREGAPWIVDDRFLALIDNLAERLQKWLDEA